ncbi:hypothetical protein LTR56_005379 [Elasticomyces elasticus]|nr:hypothetical protein LTR22_018660 [Elasticomyces elasticus]KAK3651872.1 hypothetical protein LTR56_005379 [Elasticomyces elasticus]KAK4927767.1 hypothetical protein LTR49_005391 [Elasticomyces elasticus]KAK5761438.1 hypothetical protein LTS12_008399 [Elasticomyces elasticus]
MAPTISNATISRHVSADPKEGLWTLEYLTLLHLLYTRFAFAIPKKRSQHVIVIFQKIFKFDLLIKHPSPSRTLADRHIPDKYLFRNNAGRGGKFKEVEADPKSPEQQARVEKMMPLIRTAIIDLSFQSAVSETQVPVAEDYEDGADGKDGEEVDDGEGVDEAVEEAGEETANVKSQQAGWNDEDFEEQSRLPQQGTKRKQSLDQSQDEPASKKKRVSRPAAAAAVGRAVGEKAEGAEDGVGEEGQPPKNNSGEGLTAVRKASRVTSSWNGPGNVHKKDNKMSAQNVSIEKHQFIVEDEKSALELMSANKTPMLLKHLQQAKLNGSLGKSSNAAGLSDFLYKIDNPLATQMNAAADWEKTQLSIFNRWGQEDGAKTSRVVERRRSDTHKDQTLSGYHDAMPQSDRTTFVAIRHQQSQQPHLAAGTMARNEHSLFQSFRDRHDSAISLPSTPYATSSPAGIDVHPKTSAQPSTSPSHSSHHARPKNALLLQAFYGPKPRTSAIASSNDGIGRGVQSETTATFGTGADLASSPHQSGERVDTAQSLHERTGEVVDLTVGVEAGEAFARKNPPVRRSHR